VEGVLEEGGVGGMSCVIWLVGWLVRSIDRLMMEHKGRLAASSLTMFTQSLPTHQPKKN
jgi:hypothetical protein